MADSKLRSLTNIFNESFFRIPDFQRGYSWGEQQLIDFWEDIENLKKGHFHYTGLLTVEPIKKKDIHNNSRWADDLWLFERGMGAYYIIDGQQRLTTSIILINELLNSLLDDQTFNYKMTSYWKDKFLYQYLDASYVSYMFGYEKDNPSDEFFKTKILGKKSSQSDKVPEQTLYTQNLIFAKKFFNKKIKSMHLSEMENVFKKITSDFKFNFYEIDDDLDVYVTFETMNNRGKPLSNLELLKNRLIYLTTLLHGKDDVKLRLRTDINEAWKTIYEYLGKNKNSPLNDDEFLKDHWITYFEYSRKESNVYAKFLLNTHFTARNVLSGDIKFDDIKKYVQSISDSIKHYYVIYNPLSSLRDDDVKEWLQRLNRLGSSYFVPVIMVALQKEQDDKLVSLILKQIEAFIFLVFRLSRAQSNARNSMFYRLAYEYNTNKFGSIELAGKILNEVSGDNGRDPDSDEYEYTGYFDLEKFGLYVKESFEKRDGYYSWNGLRYILYEYEQHLCNEADGDAKVHWDEFKKRKLEESVEHVFPQTPSKQCWKNAFKLYSKKEKHRLCHSLGNLVLIGSKKNSELQNNCFDDKKCYKTSDGKVRGFQNGSFSEIKVASNPEWTAQEILARGKDILNFIFKRYGIDITEWEVDVGRSKSRTIDEYDLLGLEFLRDKIQ